SRVIKTLGGLCGKRKGRIWIPQKRWLNWGSAGGRGLLKTSDQKFMMTPSTPFIMFLRHFYSGGYFFHKICRFRKRNYGIDIRGTRIHLGQLDQNKTTIASFSTSETWTWSPSTSPRESTSFSISFPSRPTHPPRP